MAVIINDFELIVEEAPAESPAKVQEASAAPKSGPRPMDLFDVQRHRAERETRLRAH